MGSMGMPRGGGFVRLTLSVAHADIPIAVVMLATPSPGAAQAGHGAQGCAYSCLLTFSSRFCRRCGVFVLPQLQAAPEPDGLLPAGPATGDGHSHGPAGQPMGITGCGTGVRSDGAGGLTGCAAGGPAVPSSGTGGVLGKGCTDPER